jgi:hypothetical protein
MMMEKLEGLRKRRHPRPDESGEASESARAKGLRWYHKALVIPMLAIAIFGASLTLPEQAQANHIGYWGQCDLSYGTFGIATCWIAQDHYSGNYYAEGWGYWESNDVFRYMPLNDNCHYYLWMGNQWVGPWTEDFCQSF